MRMDFPVGVHRYPFPILPLRQPFACIRMKVPAQVHELIRVRRPCQTQRLRSLSHPLSPHLLPFHVVIPDLEMLPEILFRIAQTVLRLHRQHEVTLPHRNENPSLKRAQNFGRLMLPVNSMKDGTLDSFEGEGAWRKPVSTTVREELSNALCEAK